VCEVEDLVTRAGLDDEIAWGQLVDRFAGLVWSIVRSVGLSEADAADVCQTTWMRLAEHMDDIVDRAKVGAWLATTAKREAIRVSKLGNRAIPVDPWEWLDEADTGVDDPEDFVVTSEQTVTVQMAVALLPDRCRKLLMSLAADQPASYQQISAELGLPVGSIGPTRSRCLHRLEGLLRDAVADSESAAISERIPR
jgi:RNA polymerase sigma factor (sigma-70 family)